MKQSFLTHYYTYFKKFTGILIFVFSVLWFFYPGEYVLIANQDNKVFITSIEYFYSFLNRPGGIIEYIGTFLDQFLRFRFIGALIISSIVTLGYIAVHFLYIRITEGKNSFIFGILTSLLFIGLHNNYTHQLYHSIGFIIVLFTVLYIPENKAKRNIFLIFSVPIIYYFSGGYLWIFCAIVLTKHYTRKRNISLELIALLIGYPIALVLLSANFVFLFPVRELIIQPFPSLHQYGIKLFQYVFISWIVVLPLFILIESKIRTPKKIYPGFIPWAIILMSGFLILNFTYKKKNTEFFRIEKYAINEDWQGLLRYANQHPSTNLFGIFYTNIALANKGLLCSNLFDYPQPSGRQGLYLEWASEGEILSRGSDFYWTINFVNEAHHWAFESFVVEGFTQRNLRRLIQTELIRGNYQVAEKYINVLDKSLFGKKTADHYRQFLNKPEVIKNDNELGPRININIDSDFFAEYDLEINLRLLLENEPANRPALDYLMALYLLERRIEDIAILLPYYLKFTNGEIPVLLEESILVYKVRYGNDKLPNIRISQNTVTRYNNFVQTSLQYTDQEEAAHNLYSLYKNSFWFYLYFGSIPK